MKRHAGFTLIELLITITIMVILIVLSVVSLRAAQISTRDEERKTDIENIARGLEIRYNDGNHRITAPSYVQKGSYPGTNEIRHGKGESMTGFIPVQITGGYLTDLLPGTASTSFTPPNGGSFSLSCISACQPAETTAVVEAATTVSTYVYEPVTASGAVCSVGDCVRFNLYYRTEVDGVLHKIVSKHQ
jgi:prepilin-type N-terminal cleavage/methylation domain-containing protein